MVARAFKRRTRINEKSCFGMVPFRDKIDFNINLNGVFRAINRSLARRSSNDKIDKNASKVRWRFGR